MMVMRNDIYRDYVTEALRYYALCDCPDIHELNRLRDILPRESTSCYRDLEAVYRALRELRLETDGRLIMRCVVSVYFVSPEHVPTRDELMDRCHAAACELGVTTNYVYNALRKARRMVAVERGLRDIELWQ